MKIILSMISVFCLATVSVSAQNSGKKISDEESTNTFWTGTFASGQIMVNLHKIASVSQQKYILDGQMLVYEVSIDVDGNALTRIYYIEPLGESSNINAVKTCIARAKDVFGSVQNRISSEIDINTSVSKTYPVTTHSHTIEYRVASLEEINAIYKSLTTALQRGKGRTYSSAK